MAAKYCAVWLLLTTGVTAFQPAVIAAQEAVGSSLWIADTGG